MLLALLTQRFPQQQDDLQLLKRIQSKDQHALAQLYDRYANLLYSTTVKILVEGEEAEGVLHDVFGQIWNMTASYSQERGSVYAWLVTLCRNKALDRLRSKRLKEQSKELDLNEANELLKGNDRLDPQAQAALTDYQALIENAMKRLSQDQIKILELSYYKGYSQSEIAQILKMPLGVVKTKMRQGISRMRQLVRGVRGERTSHHGTSAAT